MHPVDYSLIIAYLVIVHIIGMIRRLPKDSAPVQMIVGGRVLTLPALVASLVSTWYGGILGVGEYSYLYGLSNWLVFGLPYYLGAFLFAVFLARRARESEVLTIPDRLAQAYGNGTAAVGSVIIFFMTVPAAYVLMLGVLAEQLFGWPFWVGVLAGCLFSLVYVYAGGFASVVRTDIIQFCLMFLGFIVLLAVAIHRYGGLDYLVARLPESHLTWHGGNSGWYILSWYGIALATLIEPAFYQRCYAARTESVARRGIYWSILCWSVFDFLTTSCGLYARAALPDLADPTASFPALAQEILPVGLMGLLALSMLVTVMSTVDSYLFLAGSTFGNDVLRRLGFISDRQITRFTRIGIVVSALLAVGLAFFFRSVVDIWHIFGSVGTPALLIPVFVAFVGWRRLRPGGALTTVIASGAVSLCWYATKYAGPNGDFWLGIEPIFPGLAVSLALWLALPKQGGERLPQPR